MEPEGERRLPSRGDGTGSGDTEKKKVALMRIFVEGKDPAAKEVDNFMLRRFLRARDLDIEKASFLFLKYLKWRRTAVPNGFISEAEIRNDLSQKKVFLQGFDKTGQPIVVAFGAKHYHSKRNMNEFCSFVIYVLDRVCARMPRGQEKFTCIGDLEGWGLSNCDIRACLAALDIMQVAFREHTKQLQDGVQPIDNDGTLSIMTPQNYYPERLGRVFLVHVPYLFMKAWKIIYPFIDKNTRKKFVFVEDKNLRATLLEDIDENQLPEIYGGKLPLVPIQDPDPLDPTHVALGDDN